MPKGFGAFNRAMHPCRHCGKEVKGGGIGSHQAQCAMTPAEKFWRHVQKGDGCWIYTKSAKPDGYRFFRYRTEIGGKQTQWYAHRFSWMLAFGEAPADMEVAHRCDNRGCVRPDHLFLATHDENMADCARKGRYPTSLKADQVIEVRAALQAPYRGLQKKLAQRYGVKIGVISDIARGHTFQHLPSAAGEQGEKK